MTQREFLENVAQGVMNDEMVAYAAERLTALYDYMGERLLYANLHNSQPALDDRYAARRERLARLDISEL